MQFDYAKGIFRRFKRVINVVDSTTLELVANCMDWAKHRKRKAAAKCHMRLDLQSFLPKFAIVDSAKHSNPAKAYEVCAGIKAGEIVIFDKAYVDTVHLWELGRRGIFWVTRAKDNMLYEVVSQMKPSKTPNILKDEIVTFNCPKTKEQYPGIFRRVEAKVIVDKKETVKGNAMELRRFKETHRNLWDSIEQVQDGWNSRSGLFAGDTVEKIWDSIDSNENSK
ncbi:MAG TPA: hypothetical protein DD381_07100 [Lentisphaeria bacterium]|nr:hypothetical protein [Lentisphaeria bacterium]